MLLSKFIYEYFEVEYYVLNIDMVFKWFRKFFRSMYIVEGVRRI